MKREHHPIPTLEEITPKLAGAKLFSKLNTCNGYWNVKLDEEFSYLETFNTPFERYRVYKPTTAFLNVFQEEKWLQPTRYHAFECECESSSHNQNHSS